MKKHRSQITGSFESAIVRFLIKFNILIIALKHFGNIQQAYSTLQQLLSFRRKVIGNERVMKYAKANRQYHFGLNVPAWPSEAFTHFIKSELERHTTSNSDFVHLQTLLFSVTRKCSLSCEHCFEWENLNKTENVTLDDLKGILSGFQAIGLSQVQISGGEPLQRLKDVLELVRGGESSSEYWLLTSGIGLTDQIARELSEAGFRGINISLDHWDKDKHNAFRGNSESFDWVQRATRSVLQADLQLALSICTGRDFVSHENLMKFARLGRDLGAGIIQILEPRASGRYEGQDVELDDEHIKILRDYYLEMNTDKKNLSYPIIQYPGYHQRKHGCFGAGLRFLFMDSTGWLHACPFCRKPIGDAVSENIQTLINQVQTSGCQAFNMATKIPTLTPISAD